MSHIKIVKSKLSNLSFYKKDTLNCNDCRKIRINKKTKSKQCNEAIKTKPMFEMLKDHPDSELYLKRGMYEYSHCTKETFIKILNENNNLFELIRSDRPCKVYFDLDGTTAEESNLKGILELINDHFENADIQIHGYVRLTDRSQKRAIKEYYHNIFDGDITFYKARPKDGDKHSFHICISNYHLSNSDERNRFARWFKSQSCFSEKWDTSIYGKNQAFKCINQSKKKAPYPSKYIYGSRSIKDHLLTDIPCNSVNALDALGIELVEKKEVQKDTQVESNEETKYSFVDISEDKYPTAKWDKIKFKSELFLAEKILDLLDPSKHENREDWLHIGYILYKYGNYGKKLYISFCSKMSNFDLEEINNEWNTHFKDINEGKKYTIGTLIYMITKENKSGFEELYDRLYEEANMFTDMDCCDIAEYYYEKTKGNVEYDINSNFVWNDNKLLWDEYSHRYMPNHIIEYLRDRVDILLGIINNYELRSKIIKCKKKLATKTVRDEIYNNITNCKAYINKEPFQVKLNNTLSEHLAISKKRCINMRTLNIRKRTKEDHFNISLDHIDYIEQPDERVERFFSSISVDNDGSPNEKRKKYIIDVLTYALTANLEERSIFLFWGIGANGKSVLSDIMKGILKDFSLTLSKSIVIQGKFSDSTGPNPAVLKLVGKRYADTSETNEGDKLCASTLKSLVGEDKITARPLYGDPIEFKNRAKIFLSTNHKPRFEGQKAMYDRIKLIPLYGVFVPKNKKKKDHEQYRDKKLVDWLTKTDEGLSNCFSYIIQQGRGYYENGLKMPNFMVEEQEDYFNDQDDLKVYIDAQLQVEPDRSMYTNLTNLYENYEAWANINKYTVIPKKKFISLMKNKGYVFYRPKVKGKLSSQQCIKGYSVNPIDISTERYVDSDFDEYMLSESDEEYDNDYSDSEGETEEQDDRTLKKRLTIDF